MAATKVVESGARAANGRGLSLALLFSTIGIAGLLRDSWPGGLHLPAINLHGIFGAVLWLTVVAQFCHANLGGPPASGRGAQELCRVLSRQVYLLLYILFGLSQLVRVAAILWNSGAQGTLHPAILPAPDNLRDYLAYGVSTLLTIRILAAVRWQKL